jgi:hypothetical protein
LTTGAAPRLARPTASDASRRWGGIPGGEKTMRILLAAIIVVFGVSAATAPAFATNGGGNASSDANCSGNKC